MPSRTFALAALLASAAACASAQAVISTHSGVVHYFEGAVYLNGQTLESRLGKFSSMTDGSELRTEKGRAEVLLTPGAVLRLDQNSSVRMLSNSLADTRVELLTGSAMLEASEPVPGTELTMIHQGWQARFPQAGLYRLDSNPPRLSVREGEAEVSGGSSAGLTPGGPILVGRGMNLPLNAALAMEATADPSRDGLETWSTGRADSISADNAIAANIQDPATQDAQAAYDPTLAQLGMVDPGMAGFTQFPMLGLSPISPLYSSLYPYQPGFYSLYLPGYTYRPLYLLLSPAISRTPLYSPYSRTPAGLLAPGVSPIGAPRTSTPILVRPPVTTPAYGGVRPVPTTIAPRPVIAPPIRTAPAAAPRIGGVRR